MFESLIQKALEEILNGVFNGLLDSNKSKKELKKLNSVKDLLEEFTLEKDEEKQKQKFAKLLMGIDELGDTGKILMNGINLMMFTKILPQFFNLAKRSFAQAEISMAMLTEIAKDLPEKKKKEIAVQLVQLKEKYHSITLEQLLMEHQNEDDSNQS